MTPLPPELRELIESGPLTYLSTSNRDGSPHATMIWIGLDGDDVVSAHAKDNAKLRNMRRDPRVVLSFGVPKESGVWLSPYASLHARATVEPSTHNWELVDRLAKAYVAPDADVPTEGAEPGFIVRYSIERIGGVGPWVNRPSTEQPAT